MKFKIFKICLTVGLFFGINSFNNVFAMDQKNDGFMHEFKKEEVVSNNKAVSNKVEQINKNENCEKIDQNEELTNEIIDNKIDKNDMINKKRKREKNDQNFSDEIFKEKKEIDSGVGSRMNEGKDGLNFNKYGEKLNEKMNEINDIVEKKEIDDKYKKGKTRRFKKNVNIVRKFRVNFDIGEPQPTEYGYDEKVFTFLYFVAMTNFSLKVFKNVSKYDAEPREKYVFDVNPIYDKLYALSFLNVKITDFGFLNQNSKEENKDNLKAYIEFSYIYYDDYDKILRDGFSKVKKNLKEEFTNKPEGNSNIKRMFMKGVPEMDYKIDLEKGLNGIFDNFYGDCSLSNIEKKIFVDVRDFVFKHGFTESLKDYFLAFRDREHSSNSKKIPINGNFYRDFMFNILFCDNYEFDLDAPIDLFLLGDGRFCLKDIANIFSRSFKKHCKSDVMKKVSKYVKPFEEHFCEILNELEDDIDDVCESLENINKSNDVFFKIFINYFKDILKLNMK